MRFDETKLDSSWNFINKIWNASRYVQMQMEDGKTYTPDFNALSESDMWILSRLEETLASVSRDGPL